MRGCSLWKMPSSVVMPETNNTIEYGKVEAPTTQKNTSYPKFRKRVRKFLNEPYMQVFMSAILMVSLFFPDAWILANAPDHRDNSKDGVLTSVLSIFIVEITVLILVQDGYNYKSFYFWMDIFGTVSMIIDINWISDQFIPEGSLAAQGAVIRATRAAKLAARYGRLLRLMRLSRFLKILPCFKTSDDEQEYEPTMAAIKKVSNQLSELLSMRTAILVLILVIVIPFLNYTTTDYSYQSWLTHGMMVAKNETITAYDAEYFIYKCREFYETKDANILRLKMESPYLPKTKYKFKTRETQRHDNIMKYLKEYYVDYDTLVNSGNTYAQQYAADAEENGRLMSDNTVEFRLSMWIDTTVQNQTSSMFNILIIIMVIVLLFTFTGSFNSTVNELVVQPLEKMMTTLRNSATIMLKSMKAFESAQAQEEEKNGKEKKNDSSGDDDDSDIDDAEMETAKLEKMVEKLFRIVQHIAPSNNEIADANIDKNTANWLNQSYAVNVNVNKEKKDTNAHDNIGDEGAIKIRLKRLEESLSPALIDQLNTWDFDTTAHETDITNVVIQYIFTRMNLLEEFKVPEEIFKNFVFEISNRYINTNSYHNYKHGSDVCFTSFRLLHTSVLNTVFTQLEMFSLLIAALAHDVGHLGYNNAFLVKSRHELAINHNDRSPLENMHCVVLYEILSRGPTNIFVNLTKKQWTDARNLILTIILGTDMVHHFEQIHKTQVFLEVHGEDTKGYCAGTKDVMDCMNDDKNRIFTLELVLHCSDISNPFKPFALCSKWADLVVEEFCQQGDKEKSLGLDVSPMCDRDAINLYNMQMGFIEFVVAPLIIAFVNVFPPVHEIGSNMLNNFQSWGELRKNEIRNDTKLAAEKKPEELTKVDERLAKFADKFAFLAQLRIAPVRKRRHSGSTTM